MSDTGFSPFPARHSPFSVMLDIDTIVRQIMTDLTVTAKPVPADIKTVTNSDSLTAVNGNVEKPHVNEIYIDNRVISLADLNEQIGGATKLFISPKSILTPSVKDEIRKRKIEVAVKLPLQNSQSISVIWLAFHQPATFSYNLLNQLQKEFVLKQKSFATLTELLNETEQQLVHETTRGVAVTKHSATAIRLANQRNTIRAIGCVDPKQSVDDTIELNANLLVIHPERVSNTKIFEIVKQLQKF
ncbi:MAG: hypothetical protein LBE12_04665 [Planctomycetaceae bacterium]|jgi:hypothetical protein|nr:hypothetical protein [Planctomycetaceae bacterium]